MVSFLGSLNMFGASVRFAVRDYRAGKKEIKKWKKEKNNLWERRKKIKEKGLAKYKEEIFEANKRIGFLTQKINVFENAKLFLFHPNWLESQIEDFGLEIHVDHIRREANKNELLQEK